MYVSKCCCWHDRVGQGPGSLIPEVVCLLCSVVSAALCCILLLTEWNTRLHRQDASSTSRGSSVSGHLKSMPTTSANATSKVSTAVSPLGSCVWSMKGFLWRSHSAA